MPTKEIEKYIVNKDCSIKEAMKSIDKRALGVAFIVEDGQLFGVVTDGDIRRAILEGKDIRESIGNIANKNPIVIFEDRKEEEISRINQRDDIKKMITRGSSFIIPVVDRGKKIKDIISLYLDKNNNFQALDEKSQNNNRAVKKVLVIGGAGYLGSVLCRKLIDRGYEVKVLDNLTYGNSGLIKNHRFEFVKGDIRNISDIVEAIKGVDAVIHLAGIVGDPACAENPEETLEINYLAAKSIIDVCKYFQVNRFIFSSSCSVYGASLSPNEKLTEESPLNPVSLYAKTKIECEKSAFEAIDENFSPTILRMATLYGYSPNMRFDLVLNLLTAKAVFENKITIFGGNQWRPWLHLEDAAQSYIDCLESPIDKVKGEVFNVLSENYKMIELADIIKSVCPKAEIEISESSGDKRNYNVSSDKIIKTLNYSPFKKVVDGAREIKEIIDKGLVKNYKDERYRTN